MVAVISSTLLLFYMYFLQGLPYGLQARFLPIYFRTHGMSLSNIGFIKILFIPWLCKFFWAPLVDRYGNKTLWLTWSMLGLCGTCLLTAFIEPHWLLPLCGILLLFNFLTSTQDIATDGLAIEILTASEIANGNIAQVVGYKTGAIVGGGLLAWLNNYINWGAIFTILALNYAVAIFVVRAFTPNGKSQCDELTVTEPQDPQSSRSGSCREMFMPKSVGAENKGACSTFECASFASSLKNINKSSVTSRCVKNYSGRSQLQQSHMCSKSSGCCDLPSTSNSVSQRGHYWIQEHFSDVLNTEGTTWILVYVLLYKLGEQGALNMMPMFLIDHGMAAVDVGIWTGVLGQAASIAGSVVGGVVISQRYTSLDLLKSISVIKILVLSGEASVIFLLADSPTAELSSISRAACVILMLLLLVVSGATSTAAFTLMMQCSQQASATCQASHYSLLATAEVFGKLLFSVCVGALTDAVGYPAAFAVFTLLSFTVMSLFICAPRCLLDGFSQQGMDGTTKTH